MAREFARNLPDPRYHHRMADDVQSAMGWLGKALLLARGTEPDNGNGWASQRYQIMHLRDDPQAVEWSRMFCECIALWDVPCDPGDRPPGHGVGSPKWIAEFGVWLKAYSELTAKVAAAAAAQRSAW
jgi:hypothetical protein